MKFYGQRSYGDRNPRCTLLQAGRAGRSDPLPTHPVGKDFNFRHANPLLGALPGQGWVEPESPVVTVAIAGRVNQEFERLHTGDVDLVVRLLRRANGW